MKIKIALMLLILLPSLSPAAEHYYSFKTLDVRSGLSQNTVNSIIQDRKGFMWLATKDGLNRYDGDEFVVLRNLPSDPNSLCNNFITTLLEDSSGNIWVGTDNGLDLFIVDEERFHHIPLPRQAEQAPKSTILDLKQAPGGNIWFSIESVGLIEYDLKTQHTRIFSAQDQPALSNISSIYFTPTGTTYLGCYGHGLYYISMRGEILPYTDPATGKQPFAGSLITSITTAPYNGIYIGSMDKGVRELNFSSSQLREVLTTDSKRDLVRCRALLMANTSELLCGTESGLFIVDISTQAIPQASTLTTPQATTHLRSSYYDPYALSANSIYSIYKDREGGIWLGTYFGGVNYNNPRFDAFEKYYPTNTPDCLRGKRVREIVEDPSGTLWVGTEDEGLQIFDPQTRSFSQFEPSQLFNNIHGLCLVGEQLWVGTISKGIRVIDTRKRRLLRSYDASNALIDNNIYSIRNTQMGGGIYIGTQFGLMLYKPESNSFEEIEPLRGKQIYDIHEDLQGNIWLATYSDGIFRYRPSERRAKQYLHDNSDPGSLPYDMVLSVFEDSQQRIWLTTQGGGCCLYSPQSDSFTSYNTASGLPDNTIYQIVEDHEGLLWMSTNKGLACFDPTTSTVCATFSSDNGLLNNQFNYKSSHIAPDGKIYFGSTEGLIAFYPKQLHYSVPQPEIVVSSLSVLGQRVSPHSSDTPLSTIIDKTSSLTLRHNQNSFSLKLVSPNYISPQSNQIEYQLSGFDEQWIQGGINPRASYTNIPPGSYTFRARFQSKADSPQSSPERQIRIHITPPFYSSNVAIAIYLLLAAISITRAVYVIRRRNLARYRAKLAQVDKAKEKAIHDSKIETYTNAAHIKFLDKLNDVIDSNYDDPEFSIDTIAAKLNMSRATFYRKTSEVMEMSPNDYLRLIRLKKAAKLMQEGSSRISEICYQVGFSSPSYFTKCFSAQFGMSPKEYIESRSATKC